MTDLDDLKALYATTYVGRTSRIGNRYERRYVDYLLRNGNGYAYVYATTSRQSRGPFDVHAVRSDGRCDHVQCKSSTLSCTAASALGSTLEPYAWCCHVGVVHRTKKKEFCEHG